MTESQKDSSASDKYKDFSLVSGGLLYDLMAKIRGNDTKKYGQWRRAIFFALLTWLPLLILALIDGTMIGDKTDINFWEDITIHIRFLFVVPFLILVEKTIDESFVDFFKTTERIISRDNQKIFDRLVGTIDRMSNSYIPEIIILVSIYLIIILRWNDLPIFNSSREFLAQPNVNKLSPAGWYYFFVSFPFYLLMVFRWIWRWMIWFYSLVRISRLRFKIEALHADKMGGLGYLNLVPLAFTFLFLAPSAGLAASFGMEILYDGKSLNQYYIEILMYGLAVPIILYSPLLFFAPMMKKAMSRSIHQFGDLLTRHNNDYYEKWITGPPPKGDQLLGSVDNSSLSDINGSYGPVQGTKLVPLNYKMIFTSIILILLPFIPLIFTSFSGNEVLIKLIETLFGS